MFFPANKAEALQPHKRQRAWQQQQQTTGAVAVQRRGAVCEDHAASAPTYCPPSLTVPLATLHRTYTALCRLLQEVGQLVGSVAALSKRQQELEAAMKRVQEQNTQLALQNQALYSQVQESESRQALITDKVVQMRYPRVVFLFRGSGVVRVLQLLRMFSADHSLVTA